MKIINSGVNSSSDHARNEKELTLELIPQATVPEIKRIISRVKSSNHHAGIPELKRIKSGVNACLNGFNSGKYCTPFLVLSQGSLGPPNCLQDQKLLQHRPQIAKACKRFFWAAPCIGSSSNFYTQYSVAQPAPAPGTSTQSAPRTQRAPATRRHPVFATRTASTGTPAHSTTRAQPAPSTLFPPRAQPADSTQHEHPAPAPCLHHAHSQLTVHHAHPAPSNGAQHWHPFSTMRTAGNNNV